MTSHYHLPTVGMQTRFLLSCVVVAQESRLQYWGAIQSWWDIMTSSKQQLRHYQCELSHTYWSAAFYITWLNANDVAWEVMLWGITHATAMVWKQISVSQTCLHCVSYELSSWRTDASLYISLTKNFFQNVLCNICWDRASTLNRSYLAGRIAQ